MTEDQILSTPLAELELPIRARNCLKAVGAETVGTIIDLFEDPEALADLRGFGRRSYFQTVDALAKFGVRVIGDPLSDGQKALAKRRALKLRKYSEPGTSVYLTKPEIFAILGATGHLGDLNRKLREALYRIDN